MGFNTGQMAQTALIAQGAGSAMSAVGSYYGAKTQKNNLAMAADAAESNARLAALGAQNVFLQRNQEVANLTLKARQVKGRQRAALAANGVAMDYGSAAEIQASTDIMKEIDLNTLEANAVRSAWGYRTQATNFTNEARTARTTASQINPTGAAVSSLLTGAGSVASSWYSLNKSGALKGTYFDLG